MMILTSGWILFADAAMCNSIGFGGCSDGGCHRSGGYCQNNGFPPFNNCRCLSKNQCYA